MMWLTGCKRQGQCLLMAVGFFTRLPIPASLPFDSELFRHCSRYFAVIGWLIGALTALAYWVFALLFPMDVSVLLSMLLGILLTGAFHEDGLADSADGLIGGMTLDRRLEIMKDSRIGTYGAIALVGAFLLKFYTLQGIGNISPLELGMALLVIHTLSRSVSATLMFELPYVRSDATSKVKTVAEHQSKTDLLVLILTGLLPLCLLTLQAALLLLAIHLLTRQACRSYLLHKLGGYTGDCLGGVQQCCELTGYLTVLAWIGLGHSFSAEGVWIWLISL